MEDPEHQDSGEDVERDNVEAEATSSVRPFINPFFRNYDPLGPLRAQLASINRTLRSPVLGAIARNNAVIAASRVPAVKPPQLSIFRPAQIAAITGSPVWSKGMLNAMAATTAWQRSVAGSVLAASVIARPQLTFLSSAQLTRLTGLPVWSKGVLAAAAAPRLSIPSTVRLFENNWMSSYTSPLSSLVLQAGSFQSSLHQIAGTINRVFTEDLFSRFDTLRGLFREWLPDNLRDVDAGVWMWLLRISAKDGTCLAWAPRAEIVAELLALRRSEDRQRCLMEHRLEVVEDVEASLKEVDHPDLLDLRELTLQAAACIRDGHDAPAQALLANVLDTVMRAHGHAWLRSYFPQAAFPPNPNTGSHKMIAGAHGTYSGSAQLRMLGPYLLVNAMKNVFSGVDRQHTLNRHLGAHKASADSYRSEFAFAALLNTQALLRLVDRYLYA
ncbi:hypothetical protein [Streptomyces prasinus]|uniref:hypothetical protein n=1 Tax=Streptomyces prasinus TaxID=67345 RepID=UPI00367AEEAA